MKLLSIFFVAIVGLASNSFAMQPGGDASQASLKAQLEMMQAAASGSSIASTIQYDESGWAPIHHAAKSGDKAKALAILASNKELATVKTSKKANSLPNFSPVMIALFYGHNNLADSLAHIIYEKPGETKVRRFLAGQGLAVEFYKKRQLYLERLREARAFFSGRIYGGVVNEAFEVTGSEASSSTSVPGAADDGEIENGPISTEAIVEPVAMNYDEGDNLLVNLDRVEASDASVPATIFPLPVEKDGEEHFKSAPGSGCLWLDGITGNPCHWVSAAVILGVAITAYSTGAL